MKDGRTTLASDSQESEILDIPVGIPHGSSLSPILFLFYNAELLEICNPTRVRVSSRGFIEDVNPLAYESSTEDNHKQLVVHNKCLSWAKKYGALFASGKCILMHFSRRKTFNIQETL